MISPNLTKCENVGHLLKLKNTTTNKTICEKFSFDHKKFDFHKPLVIAELDIEKINHIDIISNRTVNVIY